MAEPKVRVLFESMFGTPFVFRVWCNDIDLAIGKIKNLAGIVLCARDTHEIGCIRVSCDHRYDAQEIQKEILNILISEMI